MAVGLKVGFYYYHIGTGDFLHAFFSNICYHLEDNKWGSKYPLLMKELYMGMLRKEDVIDAKKELDAIRASLSNILPDKVIWDIEDISKQPPWGTKISKDILNLGNYFVTSDGEDLIGHMNNAFNKSIEHKLDITIKNF